MSETIAAVLIQGFVLLASVALAAFYARKAADRLAEKVNSLHLEVNSRLSALLEVTKAASHAEGREAGRLERLTPPGSPPSLP